MGREDEFRRKRLVPATDIPPDEPPEMPWRPRARASLNERNWREAVKRFFGDPKRAAQYIPIAQAILGGLVHQLRLGGIEFGHRIVNLPDGSRIRVLHNSGINVIEIFAPVFGQVVSELIEKFLHGFIVYPKWEDAPFGKTTKTENGTTSLVVMEKGFDYYNDVMVGSKQIRDLICFGGYTYKVEKEKVTFEYSYPQRLLSGNQFYFHGEDVYSWWGSPLGDGPMIFVPPYEQEMREMPIYFPFLIFGDFTYLTGSSTRYGHYACVFKTHESYVGGTKVHHFQPVPINHIYKNGSLYAVSPTPVAGVGVVKSKAGTEYVIKINYDGRVYEIEQLKDGEEFSVTKSVLYSTESYRLAWNFTISTWAKRRFPGFDFEYYPISLNETPGTYSSATDSYSAGIYQIFSSQQPNEPYYQMRSYKFNPTSNEFSVLIQKASQEEPYDLKKLGYTWREKAAIYGVVTASLEEVPINPLGVVSFGWVNRKFNPAKEIPFRTTLKSVSYHWLTKEDSGVPEDYRSPNPKFHMYGSNQVSLQNYGGMTASTRYIIDSTTQNDQGTHVMTYQEKMYGKIPLGLGYTKTGELKVVWYEVEHDSTQTTTDTYDYQVSYGDYEVIGTYTMYSDMDLYGSTIRYGTGGGVIGDSETHHIKSLTVEQQGSGRYSLLINDDKIHEEQISLDNIASDSVERYIGTVSEWWSPYPSVPSIKAIQTRLKSGYYSDRWFKWAKLYSYPPYIMQHKRDYQSSTFNVSTKWSVRFIDAASQTLFYSTACNETASTYTVVGSGSTNATGWLPESERLKLVSTSTDSSSHSVDILRIVVSGGKKTIINRSIDKNSSVTKEDRWLDPSVSVNYKKTPPSKRAVQTNDLPELFTFRHIDKLFFAADWRFDSSYAWAMVERIPEKFTYFDGTEMENSEINDQEASFDDFPPKDTTDIAPIGLF